MIRYRNIYTATYGHYADVLSLYEQLNEVSQSRGWRTATFLAPTVGEANVLIAEYEFPDLATFEAESKASMSDPEWMKIYRAIYQHVYPQSARTELLEEAPHLA